MSTSTSTPRWFVVDVSGELLHQLQREWSEPVQVMVEDNGVGGYAMTFRRVLPDPKGGQQHGEAVPKCDPNATENARPVQGSQRPAALTPTGAPTSDQRRGAPPLRAVPPAPDGLGISERTLMFGARKSRR